MNWSPSKYPLIIVNYFVLKRFKTLKLLNCFFRILMTALWKNICNIMDTLRVWFFTSIIIFFLAKLNHLLTNWNTLDRFANNMNINLSHNSIDESNIFNSQSALHPKPFIFYFNYFMIQLSCFCNKINFTFSSHSHLSWLN